eukprot:s521_g2.t1
MLAILDLFPVARHVLVAAENFLLFEDLISKGSLRADELAKAIVPSLLKTADRIRRGHAIRSSSALEVGSEVGLLELGWLLGGTLNNPHIQKAFGIPRSDVKTMIPVTSPFLPKFFLAEREALVESVQTAISLIGENHGYMLVRDEVVYAKTFGLMYGLCDMAASEEDASKAYIVGGKHPEKSLLPPEEWTGKLERSDLATVHACTLLKSVNRLGGGYQVQQIPRQRLTDAAAELGDIAALLQACCQANGDVPPVAVAFDGHGSFASIHDLLIGMLPPAQFAHLPVLKDMKPAPLGISMPLFPFRHMIYKQEDKPIFGCVDPKHILKALARCLRAPSRIFKMFLGVRRHVLELVAVLERIVLWWVECEQSQLKIKACLIAGGGYRAASYDIKLSPQSMDVVSKEGFFNLLLLVLRLLPYGLISAGPPCSLFIFLSASVHLRHSLGVRGNEKNRKVKLANFITENLATCIRAVMRIKYIFVIIEQPLSSTMFELEIWQEIWLRHAFEEITTYMGCFGHFMMKPSKLLGNMPQMCWLQRSPGKKQMEALRRKVASNLAKYEHKLGRKLVLFKRDGKSVSGGKDLPLSASYTPAYCSAACEFLEIRRCANNVLEEQRLTASSERKISAEDRANFSQLAKSALDQACTLASVCQVGRSAESIRKALMEWWPKYGLDLLVVEAMNPEDEEAEDQHDEAEADDGSIDTKNDICHAVEVAETDVLLVKELQELAAKAEDWEFAHEVPDVSAKHPDLDSDEEAGDPPAKQSKTESNIRTLRDVLTLSGLKDFKPADDDSEGALFSRMRTLAPFMQSFNLLVRSGEKILSKAALTGRCKEGNKHNIWEHELAQARLELHCDASRQSRHALWADYSSRLQEAVAKEAQKDESVKDGLVEVTGFEPNSGFSSIGPHRACQVLLVRPYQAGGEGGCLRLAVTIAVWRGGKGKKAYVWPDKRLPVNAATKIHVKILCPQHVQDEQKRELLVASSLSAVTQLDAHDGTVMMEIPENCFKYCYETDYLKVWVDRKSLKAIKHVLEAGVPWSLKKKEDQESASKLFYNEEDFAKSAQGHRNAMKYMSKMRQDYAKFFADLESKDGMIKLRSDVITSWNELLSRSQSYFKKYQKGSAFFKGMSKEMQSLSQPGVIDARLGAVQAGSAGCARFCFLKVPGMLGFALLQLQAVVHLRYIDRPWLHFLSRWAAIDDELQKCFGEEAFTMLDMGSCAGFFSLQAAVAYPAAMILGVEGSVGIGNGTIGVDGSQEKIIASKGIQTHLRWIQRLNLRNCLVAPDVWDFHKVATLASKQSYLCDVMLLLSVVHHMDNVSFQQYSAKGLTRPLICC